MVTSFLTRGALVALLAAASTAVAQTSTFRFTQVFSNLDGSVQFVELTESAGLNGQQNIAGLELTSTRNGVVKRFTVPHDLPTDRTANMSIVIATSWLWPVDDSAIAPDVLGLPARFLPTDGGTIEFAGTDRVTYASLPSDGIAALYREGDTRHATFPSNGRCAGTSCPPRFMLDQSEVFAIEYHHAALDHYFLSASAPDIDALDSAQFAGWQRTGFMLHVGGGRNSAKNLDQPVCRFYIPPGEGDSHFLSASADECETTRTRFPRLVLETTAAFYTQLPDATGQCGSARWPSAGSAYPFLYPLFPVYRLWNGRRDSNHRYTMSFEIRAQMILLGYQSEGYGPDGVAMCVLPLSPWDY